MKSYRQIVRDTGKALRQHELGSQPRLVHLWDQIQWQEVPQAEVGRTAAPIPGTAPLVIALYPSLLRLADHGAQYEVLKAFGNTLLGVAGARAATLWAQKLVLPDPAQIDAARSKIQDPELRRNSRRYADLLQTYPEKGSAADRLVFVHIANALLANNVPYGDAAGVDVKTWGPTAEYCALKRYHSLIPLVTHYCPPEVVSDYGAAFALEVLQGQPTCGDSSVRAALQRLIRDVASRLTAYPDVL